MKSISMMFSQKFSRIEDLTFWLWKRNEWNSRER